jgi:ADP-heptose:LPS heptosyltransferase
MKETDKLNYDYLKQVKEIPRLLKWSLSRKKHNGKSKKILIVNTCLIGDIAASIYALKQFMSKRPDAKIDIIVSSPMKSIMEKIKGVNKIYPAKSSTGRSNENVNFLEREDLKKNNYDLVVVVRLSKDAHNLLKKVNAKEVQASAFSFVQYIFHLLNYIIHRGNPKYDGKVKQYREVNFEWFGEEDSPKNFSFNEFFNFSKDDYKKIKDMKIMQGKEKKIIIHAATGWKKHWDNKRWIELLKRINKLGKFKFIFVGSGKQEEKDFESIRKKLNFKVYSLIDKINLAELLLIMKLSNYFIGIDSGPRNLAHLVGLRSVSLFGPGPKHFMPHNKKDIVIDKSNCKCTHLFCFKDGLCIKEITVDDVFEGFKKLLS